MLQKKNCRKDKHLTPNFGYPSYLSDSAPQSDMIAQDVGG